MTEDEEITVTLTKFGGGGFADKVGAAYINPDRTVIAVKSTGGWLYPREGTNSDACKRLSALLIDRFERRLPIDDIVVKAKPDFELNKYKISDVYLVGEERISEEPKAQIKIDPKEYEDIKGFGAF